MCFDSLLSPHRYPANTDAIPIGSAKDFEVVRKLRNVVALSDERVPNLPGDDGWEHIYDEEQFDTRPSYSSVLRGNER